LFFALAVAQCDHQQQAELYVKVWEPLITLKRCSGVLASSSFILLIYVTHLRSNMNQTVHTVPQSRAQHAPLTIVTGLIGDYVDAQAGR
jgi:hypothetical protein